MKVLFQQELERGDKLGIQMREMGGRSETYIVKVDEVLPGFKIKYILLHFQRVWISRGAYLELL